MTDYAFEALKTKRAEITGEIARCHASLARLSDDLEHLDATLRIFAPDFVAESVLPKVFVPPASWSKRGEMSRAVLSILRLAKGPISTREIATMIVTQRGLEADAGILNIMTPRVELAGQLAMGLGAADRVRRPAMGRIPHLTVRPEGIRQHRPQVGPGWRVR
jgi:hypothetical protein